MQLQPGTVCRNACMSPAPARRCPRHSVHPVRFCRAFPTWLCSCTCIQSTAPGCELFQLQPQTQLHNVRQHCWPFCVSWSRRCSSRGGMECEQEMQQPMKHAISLQLMGQLIFQTPQPPCGDPNCRNSVPARTHVRVDVLVRHNVCNIERKHMWFGITIHFVYVSQQAVCFMVCGFQHGILWSVFAWTHL